MQPYITSVRSHLTQAELLWLIKDSPDLKIQSGLELIDRDLNVMEDITDSLVEGDVTRESYANLHSSSHLRISRELAWGQALVRPYLILSSNDIEARFNLGAYFTNTPTISVGYEPRIYDVEGYDHLHALNTPTGEAYAVQEGESYVTKIQEILSAQGYTKFFIDPTRADVTLPTSKVWPLDEQTTWLIIVNDLLAALGYAGIWSDWDGVLKCLPYHNPTDRQPEFTYVVNEFESMLSQNRSITRDYFFVPNRWVAIRSNNIDGPTPVEGDGIFTYVNLYEGDTSVEARNGLITTRILRIDAADQEALIAQTMHAVNTDIELSTKIDLETSPNPLHWHFDVMTVQDPDMGPDMKVMCTRWSLGFKSRTMQQTWSVV